MNAIMAFYRGGGPPPPHKHTRLPPLQRLEPVRDVRWHAGSFAAVDLGLLHPFMQCLRRTADLRCDRNNRRPARGMFAPMVQNHPHRTGPDFRREFVRRLACHGSTFSRVGASGNPGAVQAVLASPFKSELRLEAENAVLRHQLIVLRRRLHGRVRLTNNDRWFLIQLYRWFPSILQVLTIIRPETLVRWHRAGFRCYWRWKSRPLGGRPRIDTELRVLIQRMSVENPLWGAPRIHGELLKLGFEVAQSSVAKYMVKRRGPPSQGWRTFQRNHAPDIAAMDLFVVPTIGFDLLYAFVIVRLGRRDLVWINVTAYPIADWVARQITEAFPWNGAPRSMTRDRDRIYNETRTHLALDKDAPLSRAVKRAGRI